MNKREEPAIYVGMMLEIMSAGGEELFEGKIVRCIEDDFIELEKMSDDEISIGDEQLEVQARGFNGRRNYGIWMKGTLSRFTYYSDSKWILKDLTVVGRDSGRTFSRQYTGAAGVITAPKISKGQPFGCEIRNISAGGVCVRTSEDFAIGDELSLEVKVRPGKEQPPLKCVVRRIIHPDKDVKDYGCQFVDNGDKINDIIIKIIIELQIMSME